MSNEAAINRVATDAPKVQVSEAARMWFHRFVTMPVPHAEAIVDLAALTANARLLKKAAGGADLMAVVKADGYGHGAVPAAQAALAGGATVVGVATLSEAIAIRAAGIDAPLVTWLWAPGEDVRSAIAVGAQITVSSPRQLQAVIAAADSAPATPAADRMPELRAGCAAIHVKVDTGMARNGVQSEELPALLADISAAQRDGTVHMVGLMSHLACADVPTDESVDAQIHSFRKAVEVTEAAGLRPRWRHLANTAATLAVPAAHFDMVRCGIGLYGLSPLADRYDLAPAMTLRTHVALTKSVPAGQGVGYGLTYQTDTSTLLALVPVGYGDGIPRGSGNRGEVFLAGRRRRIVGRVSMDQIVVDCGDGVVSAGDEVLLFGAGTRGEPTADDWAGYCDTINYEIVTRISPRVTRRYVGGPDSIPKD